MRHDARVRPVRRVQSRILLQTPSCPRGGPGDDQVARGVRCERQHHGRFGVELSKDGKVAAGGASAEWEAGGINYLADMRHGILQRQGRWAISIEVLRVMYL